MDLSQLNWLKNVKPQSTDHYWAYELPTMPIQEARIFCLNWRNLDDKQNAESPAKGDLILLLQRARVTHVVEFLDDEVYKSAQMEWGMHRVVKTIWMPPNGFAWENLPKQEKIFGFEHIVYDGLAHSLASTDKMPQFQKHWQPLGRLPAFQKYLSNELAKISEMSQL
jgi:hypothetical protein